MLLGPQQFLPNSSGNVLLSSEPQHVSQLIRKYPLEFDA